MQFYIHLAKKTDLLKKVIIKCVNIKLWDILGRFYYILNAPLYLFYLHYILDALWLLLFTDSPTQ